MALGEGAQIPESGRGGAEPGNHAKREWDLGFRVKAWAEHCSIHGSLQRSWAYDLSILVHGPKTKSSKVMDPTPKYSQVMAPTQKGSRLWPKSKTYSNAVDPRQQYSRVMGPTQNIPSLYRLRNRLRKSGQRPREEWRRVWSYTKYKALSETVSYTHLRAHET